MLRRRAAVSSHRCALKCLTQRAVRRVGAFCVACGVSGGVSGIFVWLVACRVACRGFLCGLWRAVRSVSGWHLWRVGLALVTCRVACRGFLCGLWRVGWRVEFCRKLDFFKHLRKKANKRTDSGREICRILSKSVESWIFQRMSQKKSRKALL